MDQSPFFEDRRLARPIPPGTVARGQLAADPALSTGKVGDKLIEQLPVSLNMELLARGRERFEIFCSPCHGRVGTGEGAVTKRGLRPPPSYHIPRLQEAPIGHFFDVMTNGFGVMPDYASQIPVPDRWAVAAYIRALQLSQHAPVAALTPEDRAKVEQAK